MLLLQHAVLYVVGESLPKTDFLTQIDKCIVLTTLTLASTGYNSRIIAWMHETHGEATAVRWNHISEIATLVVYAVCTAGIFLPAFLRARETFKAASRVRPLNLVTPSGQ
jgi:hypothetical protein